MKSSKEDRVKKILENMNDIIKIQCSNGNWNYSPYMHGIANGLIMGKSLVDGKEPVFLDAPKKWLQDRPFCLGCEYYTGANYCRFGKTSNTVKKRSCKNMSNEQFPSTVCAKERGL